MPPTSTDQTAVAAPGGNETVQPADNAFNSIAKALVLVLGFPVLATVAGIWLNSEIEQSNLSWITLVFGSFGVFTVLVFLGAVCFHRLGIGDRTQSLGLPRNTVRSLLTFLIFMFLMIFIIFSAQSVMNNGKNGELQLKDLEAAQAMIDKLDLKDRVLGMKVGTDGSVTVEYRARHEEILMEYFDKILLAILGITSSIIGFYFGNRGREAAEESKGSTNASGDGAGDGKTGKSDKGDGVGAAGTGQAGEGAEAPAIEDSSVSFTVSEGGGLKAAIAMAPLPSGAPIPDYGAAFEPSKTHDTPLDKAVVKAVRAGNTLEITVTGVDTVEATANANLALFLAGQEETTVTLPVLI